MNVQPNATSPVPLWANPRIPGASVDAVDPANAPQRRDQEAAEFTRNMTASLARAELDRFQQAESDVIKLEAAGEHAGQTVKQLGQMKGLAQRAAGALPGAEREAFDQRYRELVEQLGDSAAQEMKILGEADEELSYHVGLKEIKANEPYVGLEALKREDVDVPQTIATPEAAKAAVQALDEHAIPAAEKRQAQLEEQKEQALGLVAGLREEATRATGAAAPKTVDNARQRNADVMKAIAADPLQAIRAQGGNLSPKAVRMST